MARALLVLVVLVPVAAAPADRLILLDGRTFIGTVTVESETVLIQMAYGELRFPKSEVQRIELKDTPEQELAKRLAKAPLNDPDALFELAHWASRQGLTAQAEELYALILKLNADHADTRRALGHVRLDGQWLEFPKAVELANSKLAAGQYDALLSDVLPALEAAAGTPDRQIAARELLGNTQLAAARFADAAKTFGELADKAKNPRAVCYETIARIIEENPDGMYVVRQEYPQGARLTGQAAERLTPGPASLARPMVLQAALLDCAKKHIDAGRQAMADAAKVEATDPDAAKAKHFRALQAFDLADALVPQISRSYRVEIVRRRIAALRRDVQDNSEKLDDEQGGLGRKTLSPREFREKVLRMVHYVDNIRDALTTILEQARPYPSELVLEIKWAEVDLKKVEVTRTILTAELDEKG